jgi:hypothetical protein
MSPACDALGEEKCTAVICCDAYHGSHCNPYSGQCEFQPDPHEHDGKALDAGRDKYFVPPWGEGGTVIVTPLSKEDL